MKRLLLLVFSVIITIASFSKEPAWLTDRTNEEAYIGVGSASMNMPAWEQKAEDNALANLAQQISVIIETNSFLATIEINNSDKEYFEQKGFNVKEEMTYSGVIKSWLIISWE